jgi:hypothetical protein
MQRDCVVCGQAYEVKSARQKYCSLRCKFGTGECVLCHTPFVRKGNTTGNFCSLKCWYEWHERSNDKECPICHKVFHPASAVRKTCSYECADQIRRTAKRNTQCETCGKKLNPSCHPRTRFCSTSCSARNRNHKGSFHKPNGAKRPHTSGYIQIKHNGQWVMEHRLAMEQTLGRPLLKTDRVHHMNGVRDDNRPENLELWTVDHKDPPGVRVSDLPPHCPTCRCHGGSNGL